VLTDFYTVSYAPAGGERWSAVYDGAAAGNDHGLAVAIDSSGNTYAAGYSTGDTTGWDFAVVKYDPSGNRQWVGTYSTMDEDYVAAVAVDASGKVYAAGCSGSPYTLSWDYVTARYDPASGDTLWVRRLNGSADADDEVRAMAVDASGNVIVTGGTTGSATGVDYTTIKYSPAGDTLWVRYYNGPANSTDWAYALALDPAGNVYVTGSSQDTATDMDYATVKYDANGNQKWVARYDGPAHSFDEGRAIAVDATGNVCVTGGSTGSGTRSDYVTVKYDATGGEVWVNRYDGPASRLDEAFAIALDATGGACVTGGSAGAGTGNDYATARYQFSGIEEAPSAELRTANVPTIVRGVLFLPASHLTLHSSLFSLSGQKVLDLKPGSNDVSRLAPGVYFVRTVSRQPSAASCRKVLVTR
jgi:WD40 repeat protein